MPVDPPEVRYYFKLHAHPKRGVELTKTRFLVPNFFTSFNFLLGIFSILIMAESFSPTTGLIFMSSKQPLVLAAWIIIWCVLFDKLDGFTAKVLKASSDFGAQFDSLADLIAFGVAPGFLVYFYIQSTDMQWFMGHRPLMLISVALYMLCASMRLARYNAVDMEEQTLYFHGLPSTFAGGFMALNVILFEKYLVGTHQQFLVALPLLLILSGLLMVSPLYLPKLMRRNNKAINLFQIINVIGGYIVGFGMIFPEYLYGLLLAYGVVGFSYGYFKKGLVSGNTPVEAPGSA